MTVNLNRFHGHRSQIFETFILVFVFFFFYISSQFTSKFEKMDI